MAVFDYVQLDFVIHGSSLKFVSFGQYMTKVCISHCPLFEFLFTTCLMTDQKRATQTSIRSYVLIFSFNINHSIYIFTDLMKHIFTIQKCDFWRCLFFRGFYVYYECPRWQSELEFNEFYFLGCFFLKVLHWSRLTNHSHF